MKQKLREKILRDGYAITNRCVYVLTDDGIVKSKKEQTDEQTKRILVQKMLVAEKKGKA